MNLRWKLEENLSRLLIGNAKKTRIFPDYYFHHVNPPGVHAWDHMIPGFSYSFLYLASLKNLYQNWQNYETVIYDLPKVRNIPVQIFDRLQQQVVLKEYPYYGKFNLYWRLQNEFAPFQVLKYFHIVKSFDGLKDHQMHWNEFHRVNGSGFYCSKFK